MQNPAQCKILYTSTAFLMNIQPNMMKISVLAVWLLSLSPVLASFEVIIAFMSQLPAFFGSFYAPAQASLVSLLQHSLQL